MNPTAVPDLNRQYLQAVLSWLDIRLEQAVHACQAAGEEATDRFRGLYITDRQARSLAARRNSRAQPQDPAASEDFDRQSAKALQSIRNIEAQASAQGQPLRLKSLSETFELDDFAWWSFILCMAPSLDLRYERIYAYLQDDVTRTLPRVDFILNLLAPDDRLARLDFLYYFEPYAPLRQFRLLVPAEDAKASQGTLCQPFRVARGVLDWLLGAYAPQAALGEWADVHLPPEDEIERGRAAEAVFAHPGMPSSRALTRLAPLVCFHGPDNLQQSLAARQLADALGSLLLEVKLTPDVQAPDALDRLSSAVRDARMLEAILCIHGADILQDDEGALLQPVFRVLRLSGQAIILSTRKPLKLSGDMPGNEYPLMLVPFDALTVAGRAELWGLILEGARDDTITDADLRLLSAQFTLSSGQIAAAAAAAMAQAVQTGRDLQLDDLFRAARFHSGHHLSELAHKIEPRYSWEDLVLPQTQMDMLREMVNMVKSRGLVLEEWGLGRKLTSGMGVSALFSGPPGTGKTLAAQIMAHVLGIDVYRIDLSTVVSKYIGETEKNLERIFTEASQSNAILFFDEADTIFGKRSEVKDAHDRYANIEVGYLLQRMENYNGVAILATNLRANLDEAFTRRLQFIINFPFPDEAYRLKIWQVLMPPGLPRSENLDLKLMADRFKMSGGSIRNIIVSAAFLAASNGGRVEMHHLMHGARRELQKMGKLLTESDFSL